MALDRWIALVILVICLAYGYTAFFIMDGGLPPFMRNNPIWPSTFPKVLSVMAALCALAILLGFEKSSDESKHSEINYRRLTDYKLGQALSLLGLMIAYALFLRPAGFLLATIVFLVAGKAILGERTYIIMIATAVIAAGLVWYLVDGILGIYLAPLPTFMMNGDWYA